MLFYSIFKTLEGKSVGVELKNGVVMVGRLHSIDQYLNVKLSDAAPEDPERYPQLSALKTCFIRGSVVRYISMSKDDVDVPLLEEAAKREALKA